MNSLQIIIHSLSDLRSQMPKTKIKRFLLRKRKLSNVTLKYSEGSVTPGMKSRFEQVKREALKELKEGKKVPVKY